MQLLLFSKHADVSPRVKFLQEEGASVDEEGWERVDRNKGLWARWLEGPTRIKPQVAAAAAAAQRAANTPVLRFYGGQFDTLSAFGEGVRRCLKCQYGNS